jgi:hypothetical protein
MRAIRWFSGWLLLLSLLLSGACSAARSDNNSEARQEAVRQDATGTRLAALSLELPPLKSVAAGDVITCCVPAQFDSAYQGSLRLQYCDSYLDAISVERGALLPADCLFLATPRAQGSAYRTTGLAGPFNATLPCAWTMPPASAATISGRGELLKVQFIVRQKPGAWSEALCLDPRPEYVQVYTRQGKAACQLLPVKEVQR